ncbi:unnamed protein product, partial [Laminaria digitata]
MVVTAWVMLELTGGRPASVGDPTEMRDHNVAAITGVNRCGGARDERAFLLMRILRRLEIKGWRSLIAKPAPSLQNYLADGIPRWPREELAANVRELTYNADYVEHEIGSRGSTIVDINA